MPLKEQPELNQINQKSEEAKFLAKNYQSDRPIKSGGTLRIIEFFMVVIIIGILSAIALPSFICYRGSWCTNVKQSEAKAYLGSMNRAQQAKYAENGAFSNSITALDLGIETQTINYNYSAIATKNAAFSYGVARSNNLRSYVGAVFLVPVSPEANSTKTTVSMLCQANSPGNIQPANPILQNDVPVCAAGSQVVR
ncbi:MULTISPECIES: type IV pilin-like G/H family protein [unclassified Microcoleus]|uniref:type IV pilin-like G/H family protein n=1 Tax=unclassified Microcoleus TaxID=2642155 RepID=UPI0025EBBE44|nr:MULTISPECIES: type IV pilin-like G/H family protein [unclassified Microcoleus]